MSPHFLRLRDLRDLDFARSKLSYRGRRSRRLCKILTFPLREYWSGLPFPSLGDLPDQGLNLRLLHWPVDSLPSEPPVYRVHFIEEETLKFYITSCSFCLCNSDYSLQSLDHIGHVVSESGDLQYQKLELVSLTLVLLFAIAQPLQTSLIMPVHVKVRPSLPHLDCCSHVHDTP